MSKDSIISISNITKRFGEVKALEQLTIDIQPGIFGLIGPNGAGKTTLLRILLGLIPADKGSARLLGHDCSGGALNYLPQIGVLHERPFFPPLMTPRQYLDDVGSLYSTSTPADELLSVLGLSDATDRRIKDLSAGMYRRLGLALALVGQPRLVFLDEPTSNLDVSGRDLVVKLIVKLHEEDNVSFFIASHILSELERACQRVAFINKGQLVIEGSTRELIQEYTRSRFRVITSNAWRLEQMLDGLRGVEEVFVDGSTSIIVEVASDTIHKIESDIRNLVKGTDVQLYGVENTGTLEDVFRKVITHV